MNWEALKKKEIVPPFVPELSKDTDLCYFDSAFKEMPLYSPPDGDF